MTDLAERIEAAGVDEQRAMLEEAFAHIHNMNDSLAPVDWSALNWPFADRFTAMLDANAYLDAAMMLATGDNAKFVALSDAMVALEKAGWPNGTWHEHLPRFIAAACLRAGGE